MIKLHLFSGFKNWHLGIGPNTELGHLYSDTRSRRELIEAARRVGLKPSQIQKFSGFVHFDLWGESLSTAKRLYVVVGDSEMREDVKRMMSDVKD